MLFHNSLFEIFSEVSAHYACHMVGSHFLHVVGDHDAYEFLETCSLWIPGSTGSPAGEFLALARFLSLPKDTPRGLFYNSLFEVFCQVGSHDRSHMISSNFFHIMFYHDLNKLLEAGGLWVPS